MEFLQPARLLSFQLIETFAFFSRFGIFEADLLGIVKADLLGIVEANLLGIVKPDELPSVAFRSLL